MKHLKLFENYKETSWTMTINGESVTITISDVEKYLKDNDVKPIDILVDEIKEMSIHKDKTDKTTLDRVNISETKYPIIIAEYNGKYTMILDGHHRLQKLINNKSKYISAYVLDLNKAPHEYQVMFK